MNVVLILPTYNERETILVLLEKASNALSVCANHTFSYLVVDDTSPDDTAKVVADYAKEHKHVHVLLGKKEGLGKALLRGMVYATEKLHADIIVQMDADLSHDPNDLPKFIKALDNGADIAIGSRYIPGGAIPENWGLHRKIFSVVGNSIVRFGLGYSYIHDWTGGYRAFYKKFFEINKERSKKYTGYVFQIAFLHYAITHGARVHEVPIKFTDRRFGHSKIAANEYIRNVLTYVFVERLRSLKRGNFKKFMVVGAIGFAINTLILELFVHFLGMHPAIGSVVGAEFAIVSNFLLNNAWTFQDKKIQGQNMMGKFVQFNTASIGAIIIQAGTVFLGTHLIGESHYRLFYIIGVGIGLTWNYLMYSRVIWKHSSKESK